MLDFEYEITDQFEITERPKEGCYIYGLLMEGAKWNIERGWLDDSDLRQIICFVPFIHVKVVVNQHKDRKEYIERRCYNCPVYKVGLSRA